ncbi:MAG: RecB family exonuclease [Actinomycetota bacterium]
MILKADDVIASPQASDRSSATLSPSRAADFLQCPLLYRFRVIDRLPERPGPAAFRGTLVHAVLERLFDHPATNRTFAAAHSLLLPQWNALIAEDSSAAEVFNEFCPDTKSGDAAAVVTELLRVSDLDGISVSANAQAWLASAVELINQWFTLEDPTRLEPAERELYVEAEVPGGLTLRGYVDRLDVAPTGEVRIVDYKTGRAPGESYEARAMFQMRFYALVLWRSQGILPAVLQLVYLRDGQVLRYSPDIAELEATERKVVAVWLAITQATRTGNWRPRKGWMCQWCPHQANCPEWGGTPPPLPYSQFDSGALR